MLKIQEEPYSGCMSQSPNLPFTYLFMLTDYVIIHQQKDQHRRTKIHRLTARGKLISPIKLEKIYQYFTTNKDTTAKSIHHIIILNEHWEFFVSIIFKHKKGGGGKRVGSRMSTSLQVKNWFLQTMPFHFCFVNILNISSKYSFN